MKPNAETLQKTEAQADRADTSMINLCTKLSEFLTYVLREAWNWPSHDHATEQAQSSDQSQSDIVYDEDCVDIVYDEIEEWAGRLLDQNFYDEPALLLQKQMDIISHNGKVQKSPHAY